MQILRSPDDLKTLGGKFCVAIGFFDGVHLGHQQIIRQTVADARQHEGKSLVITFDRHPNTIVAPEHVPPLVYSLPQKLRTIHSLRPDLLLLIHFDLAFSEQTGEAFIRRLAQAAGQLQTLCVGADFVFGYKRSGDVSLLKNLGAELRFAVHPLAAVSLDGKSVSSTRIRKAIQAGRLDDTSQMLGRAYSLAGTVIKGDGLGRQLGFPTANVDPDSLVLPPHGVYAVHAQVRNSSVRAVLNIGVRPTLNEPRPGLRVEAHLLDFNRDLYGEELEITFVDKLRNEMKFASLDELRRQIEQDIAAARQRF